MRVALLLAAVPYQPERHGPRRVVGLGFHARVFAVVARVPRGRITTYGDVAAALGHRGAARQVGYALGHCERDVPWHRVVNASGQVSTRADGSPSGEQVRLLRRDGLAVDARGRIAEFARKRWLPPQA